LIGSEDFPFIDSVKRGTSPGFPYVLKLGKLKGKKSWLGGDETMTPTPEFWRDFHAMEALLLAGERPQTLAIAQTKDERRPIAKVDQGKTRIFTIVNFVLNILVRKYFGAFISKFKEGRIDNESGVGVNVHSLDWTRLAYRLQSKGQHVIAGDFSNYDGSQNVYIMRGLCDVINKLYGDEFSLVRETIIEELINPNLIVREGVYALSGINTSGNAITVQLNGLVNMVLMRYAYLLLKHRKTGSLYNDFTDHVYMVQFGDDNVLNISDEVIEWFNQATITEALDTIGITYTDEAKTGVLVKSRTLDEVKFLKRQFRKTGLTYTAPLESDVINEMMLWVRNCRTQSENIEATVENIDSALTEATAHGEAYYKDIVARVSFACEQVGIIYHFRSFIEMTGRLAEIGKTQACLMAYAQMKVSDDPPDRCESIRPEESVPLMSIARWPSSSDLDKLPVFPPVSYAQAVVRPMPIEELSEEEGLAEIARLEAGFEEIDLSNPVEPIEDPFPRTGKRGSIMKMLDKIFKIIHQLRNGVKIAASSLSSLIATALKKLLRGCSEQLKIFAMDVLEFTGWIYDQYEEVKSGKFTEDELSLMVVKAASRIASIAAIVAAATETPGFCAFIVANVLWEELLKRILQLRIPGSSRFGCFWIGMITWFMLTVAVDPLVIFIIPLFILAGGLMALIFKTAERGECMCCDLTTSNLTDCCGENLCDECNEARQYVATLETGNPKSKPLCPKCKEILIPPPSNFLPSLTFGIGEFLLYLKFGTQLGLCTFKFIFMRAVVVVFHVMTGCASFLDGFLQHCTWNLAAFNPARTFYSVCSYFSNMNLRPHMDQWNLKGIYPDREWIFSLPKEIFRSVYNFFYYLLEAMRNAGGKAVDLCKSLSAAFKAILPATKPPPVQPHCLDFSSYEARLATFKNWTVPFVTPEELAHSGFIYWDQFDFVQCYVCRGTLGYWEPGDIASQEHRNHWPHCPVYGRRYTGYGKVVCLPPNLC
jgi:hypothetical protein